jgi:hypothetical protein
MSVTCHWAQQFCLGCDEFNHGSGPYCSQGCRLRDYQSATSPASMDTSASSSPPSLEVDDEMYDLTLPDALMIYTSETPRLLRSKPAASQASPPQTLIPAVTQISTGRRGGLVLPEAYDFARHRLRTGHAARAPGSRGTSHDGPPLVRKHPRMRKRPSPPTRPTHDRFRVHDASSSEASTPSPPVIIGSHQPDITLSKLEERLIYLTLEHNWYSLRCRAW